MQNVGGAVAIVSADQVLHTSTYGVRGLEDRKPVTTDTVFRVGSTTTSMTAALVATYVDDDAGLGPEGRRCLVGLPRTHRS